MTECVAHVSGQVERQAGQADRHSSDISADISLTQFNKSIKRGISILKGQGHYLPVTFSANQSAKINSSLFVIAIARETVASKRQ